MDILKIILQALTNIGLFALILGIHHNAWSEGGLVALIIAVVVGAFVMGYIGGREDP